MEEGGGSAAKGVFVFSTLDRAIAKGPPTAVQFDRVQFDDAGFFNIENPTRLTAPEAGLYLISASIKIPSATGLVGLYFRVNGTGPFIGGSFSDVIAAQSVVRRLSAGDFVEAMGQVNVATVVNADQEITNFCMTRL